MTQHRKPSHTTALCRAVFASSTIIAIAGPSPMQAQQGVGKISGVVTDEAGRSLAGAQVRVDGEPSAAASARDGSFRLPEVRVGDRKVIVRYIGYQPETLSVSVVAGQLKRADIKLHQPAQQLTTMRIEGQVAGQAAALNQQRATNNISSVVDAELVGRLPDQNLAEAVGRVPGVALVRDQGEGRFIQIRGVDANLNTLSVDGMRLPSPQGATRNTPMDVIPSDMIAAISVSKTLTPDMDADAIGGNVNLVTRTARAGKPLLSLNAAGGQNQTNLGGIRNFTAYAGNRFGTDGKLGLLVGGNYYLNDRGSQNFEQGWCVETTCKGITADQAPNVPTQLALRNYAQVKRTREGANGTIDYKFDNDNSLFIKGFYSKFSDDEQRFVTLVNFAQGTFNVAGTNNGTAVGGRMDKELRLRPVSQTQRSLQFGGANTLGNTRIDYTAQIAKATEDRPNTLTMVFRQSSMDFTYDVSNEDRPTYTVTKGAEFDVTKYTYNSLRQQARHVNDDDRSGKFNIERPFVLGPMAGSLKLGGSARLKSRSSVDTSNRFLNTFKAGMPAPGAPVTLAAFEGKNTENLIVGGRFNLGPQASPDGVKNFWNYYGAAVTQDVARSQVESNTGAFTSDENVYAGYAMLTLDAGPLRIIPGVRIENTRNENTGDLIKQAGTVVTIVPQTKTKNYSNVFPSVSARWSLDEQTAIRGAVTTTLVRPAFADMVPYISIPDGTSGVIASIGNPDLLPTTALHIDLMAERYFRSVGYVSAGYFHKKLSNFIFPSQRAVNAGDDLGTTVSSVSQPVNGKTGTLNGIELAWQQNLTFLPQPFSGFGLNANYTYTKSTATLPSREGTTSRLPGQAGNAANVGIFYERSRLSLRAGYNFSDKYLEVIGASALTDISVASRGQLDMSGSYRVSPNATFFVETNNLTNQPLRRFIGRSDRGWQPGGEFYKSWGMVGMRVQR